MARIVLTTIGTSGDLNPFLGLALGLRAHGHEVIFAVEDNLRGMPTELGFAVHHLTGDVDVLSPYLDRLVGGLTPLTSFKMIFEKWILPTLRPKVEELREVCGKADLMVARAVHPAAPIAAEIAGIPWVHMTMTALNIPSVYLNPVLLPMPILTNLPPFVNRFAWRSLAAVLRYMGDGRINRIRAEYGLAPDHDLLGTGNHSHTLTAVSVSSAFMPPPPDWPPYVRTTGFCFWDTPGNWQEPPELTGFLNDKSPVIAVSFGSMAPSVKDAFTRLYRTSIDAIGRIGARTLVIGAAPGVLPDPLPEGVYALPFAPFSQVYPRCAAVIHHGGNYTAGEALRAGIPALVVPWGIDLFFSASQVKRIGAGLWVHPRFYTPKVGERMLRTLLVEPHYRAEAQAAATHIAQEDGTATLCSAIEAILQHSLSVAR